jgi:NADPH:quinone reductase-like Zn-dependent oxidoreductase
MRAVVMHETGGPEVLSLEEADAPEPQDGQVLVRVRAVAVNAIEWKQRRGLYEKPLPAVLGTDISGVVEASRAEGFAEGDEVFGMSAGGGYAELAAADAAKVSRKPAALSHEQAAAIPIVGMTAWQALFDRGGLEAGQTVLIAGAAGGVGHVAVQLAHHARAHTIGTGSGRNRDFVLSLGADEYVDYTQQDVGEAVSDARVVFDTVGGDNTARLVPALAEGGVLVTIAGPPPEDAARERGARAELLVMQPSAEQLTRLAELVAGGDLKIETSQVLPLAEVQRAHELIESRRTRGKIVLTVDAG